MVLAARGPRRCVPEFCPGVFWVGILKKGTEVSRLNLINLKRNAIFFNINFLVTHNVFDVFFNIIQIVWEEFSRKRWVVNTTFEVVSTDPIVANPPEPFETSNEQYQVKNHPPKFNSSPRAKMMGKEDDPNSLLVFQGVLLAVKLPGGSTSPALDFTFLRINFLEGKKHTQKSQVLVGDFDKKAPFQEILLGCGFIPVFTRVRTAGRNFPPWTDWTNGWEKPCTGKTKPKLFRLFRGVIDDIYGFFGNWAGNSLGET